MSKSAADKDFAEISVVIRTFNEPESILRECIESVVKQEEVSADIVVIDSSNGDYIKNMCEDYEQIRYFYISSTGLSDGRNKGIEVSNHRYVAFTDPDCVTGQFWLKELYQAFKTGASITGGKVLPRWLSKPPVLLKKSQLARSNLSLLDLGGRIIEVGKIFGANFAIDKAIVHKTGNFSRNLGRVGGTLLSGEETDFCKRARLHGFKVVYTPYAVVEHQIPSSRLTFKWSFKRMYYGGLSRAVRGGNPEPISTKYNTYDYIFLAIFFLPYLVGMLRGKCLPDFK